MNNVRICTEYMYLNVYIYSYNIMYIYIIPGTIINKK